MTHAETFAPPASESADLERRVLAHERVLQGLIAYMARTEPRLSTTCENGSSNR